MSVRSSVVWILLGITAFLVACSGQKAASAPTPQPAADLGLARKGLSPSEVDLPCTQVEAASSFKVVSCRVFRHMGETVHLVGEIQNSGETAAANIEIKAVGTSAEGEVMDVKSGQVYLAPVPPGQRSPFRIFFDARDVAKVELTVTGQATDALPPASLEVTNVAISAPSSGYTHITGNVNNPGPEVSAATFIAVLRDGDGEVVEVHREKLLKPIPAGASTFDVLALHHGAKTAEVTILP